MEGSGSREDYKALSKPYSSRFLRRAWGSAILFSFHLPGRDRKNPPRKWSCRPFGCQKLDIVGSFGAIGLR